MKFRIVLAVGLFMILAVSIPVFAFSSDMSADPGCTGWTNGTGFISWTRDNTGTGIENVYYLATDGAGNTILNVSDNQAVGTGPFVFLANFPWSSSPQYNPITLSLVSPAGNGLGEQRRVLGVGNCGGLPTYEGGDVEGPAANNLYDGRINNNQKKDVAAPIAVYCTEQDTLAIFKIDAETGAGTQIINQPFVTETPAENQLLDSADGVNLYLLTTGEYQVNAPNFEGKLYSIAWIGCDSGTLVHLGA